MDVKSDFLHGDLQEEMYMQQPPGFVQNGSIPLFLSSRNLYMALNKQLALGMRR